MLTKHAAAERLGVSIRAIENYSAKGKLHPKYATGRRGKIALFDEAEVDRLKDERGEVVFSPRPPKVTAESALPTLASESPQRLAFLETIRAALTTSGGSTLSIGDKIILTLSDAAQLTSLSQKHLRQAIKAGNLKGKKIGKGWKIKRFDLDDFAAKL
jgi:excisionase family DNA binding protein